MNPQSLGLVFVGAGTGGVLRYLLGFWLNPLIAALPLGTLAANVLGCGAAGVMLGLLELRLGLAPTLRPLVIAGFLGGLTTFSSYSLEVVHALENARPLLATGIAVLHVVASLAAAVAGLAAIRALLT
jgi:fluoride exporter